MDFSRTERSFEVTHMSPCLQAPHFRREDSRHSNAGLYAARSALAEEGNPAWKTRPVRTRPKSGFLAHIGRHACFAGLWLWGCAGWAAAQVPISQIQGRASSSLLEGGAVSTVGIVTGFYFSSGTTRSGFWIQTPDGERDGDAETSEGLFISDAVAPVGLAVGDKVTVSGTVSETGGVTQLNGVSVLARVTGQTLPQAVPITLPFASTTAPERWEGMRVTAPQTLGVTDHFQLGSQGVVQVALGGPRWEPTAVVAPGAPAQAMRSAHALNRLLIDDGRSSAFPSPTPHLFGATANEATLRLGDTVAGLTGVFSQFGSVWGLVPEAAPVWQRITPRPAVPEVGGSLRVVGANLLNYFNGDGMGGGFPTSRGADSAAEFSRQRAHLLEMLTRLNGDVLGLTEMENDGFGTTSALQDLVNGLNASAGVPGTYSFRQPNHTGTDAITNALVYRTTTVEPLGAAVSSLSSTFERPPLAQTFRVRATGAVFTVCVNHFRSKGGSGTGGNADSGDGQGTNNLRRTQQAQELAAWLNTSPTGNSDPDRLIIGDLNAYAKEDPLVALAGAGYTSLLPLEGVGDPASAYTYLFSGQVGALDHALASATLLGQVKGAAAWHANAAEPSFLDYNLENKNTAQRAINDGATPWRASDHDPLLVGLALRASYAEWALQRLTSGGTVVVPNPAADHDADGRSNLLGYALGGGTALVAEPAFIATGAGGVFTFKQPNHVRDVIYAVERSANLLDWTPVPLETATRQTESDGEVWRFAIQPSQGETRVFVRLRVTLP
jgi:predicted extracellular nuclease